MYHRAMGGPATYYPVLGFMTGPPGFFRNGGLFRWLKIFLLREKNPAFLSQVLHFLDFGVRRRNLDQWLARPLLSWIGDDLPGVKPRIFLDSGGFQFLHDANDCVKTYLRESLDVDVDRGGSLDLQRRLGGDLFVSFDYPLDQRLGREEAWERCEKSLAGAVDLLARLQARPGRGRPTAQLAVHGLDGVMAGKYTRALFSRVRSLGPGKVPFGLAVGSLVPLALPRSRNYPRILQIVDAVTGAVPPEHRSVPVHALGMSGPVVPLLIYQGVRSFDGSSFIVAANNLDWVGEGGKKVKAYDLRGADLERCGCAYCELMDAVGLRRVKSILRGGSCSVPGPLRPLDPLDHSERRDGKSSVYGLLAMHNLERIRRDFRTYGRAGLHRGDPAFLARTAPAAGPEVRRALAWLAARDDPLRRALARAPASLPAPPEDGGPSDGKGTISLKLTSRSFDLRRRRYDPVGRRVALVLPCTPEKPYGASRTHQRVLEALAERFGDRLEGIEKVTLSGLYGPVPEQYESLPAVLRYDYRLRTYAIFEPQKRLVEGRLTDFVDRFGPAFRRVVLFLAKEPYRTIARRVHEARPGTILLPARAGRRDISAPQPLQELFDELDPWL